MDLSESEKQIEQNALKFARENKKAIAKRLTCIKEYPPEKDPVSVFMAGSPGAGKTESAKVLLGQADTERRLCKSILCRKRRGEWLEKAIWQSHPC